MFRRVKIVLLTGAVGLALSGLPRPAVTAAGEHHAQGQKAHGPEDWKKHPLGQLISGCVARAMNLHREMHLTDQQKKDLHKLFTTHKKAILDEAHTLWQKRTALRKAVLAETPNESDIRKAADDLGKAIGDAAVKASKLKGEVAHVLTAEQREKVKTFIHETDAAVDKFFDEASKKTAEKK